MLHARGHRHELGDVFRRLHPGLYHNSQNIGLMCRNARLTVPFYGVISSMHELSQTSVLNKSRYCVNKLKSGDVAAQLLSDRSDPTLKYSSKLRPSHTRSLIWCAFLSPPISLSLLVCMHTSTRHGPRVRRAASVQALPTIAHLFAPSAHRI